jgi:hypothetical protein
MSNRKTHIGVLQCAHLISRRYLATRYSLMNAVTLCIGCHKYYTEHPLEWEDWCQEWWGPEWSRLRMKAVAGGKVDYEEIIRQIQTLINDSRPLAGRRK